MACGTELLIVKTDQTLKCPHRKQCGVTAIGVCRVAWQKDTDAHIFTIGTAKKLVNFGINEIYSVYLYHTTLRPSMENKKINYFSKKDC